MVDPDKVIRQEPEEDSSFDEDTFMDRFRQVMEGSIDPVSEALKSHGVDGSEFEEQVSGIMDRVSAELGETGLTVEEIQSLPVAERDAFQKRVNDAIAPPEVREVYKQLEEIAARGEVEYYRTPNFKFGLNEEGQLLLDKTKSTNPNIKMEIVLATNERMEKLMKTPEFKEIDSPVHAQVALHDAIGSVMFLDRAIAEAAEETAKDPDVDQGIARDALNTMREERQTEIDGIKRSYGLDISVDPK